MHSAWQSRSAGKRWERWHRLQSIVITPHFHFLLITGLQSGADPSSVKASQYYRIQRLVPRCRRLPLYHHGIRWWGWCPPTPTGVWSPLTQNHPRFTTLVPLVLTLQLWQVQKQYSEPFEEKLLLHWFAQILLALKYVHDHNLLHRDLKPQVSILTLMYLLSDSCTVCSA